MEKITVTRALAELKMLDKRIVKKTSETLFVDCYQRRADKALKSNVTKKEFESNLVGNYKSIVDLIARRSNIKKAILKSNSNTNVKIADKTYTVAEAISAKDSIVLQQTLLDKMSKDYTLVNKKIEDNRQALEETVANMLEKNLGNDKKTDKEAYNNIASPFIEANEFNMLDPIKIKNKIDKLSEEVEEFMTEVDFVLSESNSRTDIKV